MIWVILGRSPFVAKVNVPRLMQDTVVVGINTVAHHWPVPIAFSYDDCIEPALTQAEQVFVPYWSEKPFSKIHPVAHMKKPLVNHEFSDAGHLKLAFQLFTPSMAINYAILKGASEIWLVGIDHVATDKAFQHFDGPAAESDLTPDAHRFFKDYVEACARIVPIYQCNPDVAGAWPVPFKRLKDDYVS